MTTDAVTVEPSLSRTVAQPSPSVIARTIARCRICAPAASARSSSAASNSSRITIVSSGRASDLVNSRPPRSVNVTERISSRAGNCGRSRTAPSDAPISPPPQVL